MVILMKKKKRKLKKTFKLIMFFLTAIFTGLLINSSYQNYLKNNNNSKKESVKKDKESSSSTIIPPKEIFPKEYKLSMITTGDALIHGAVYKDALTNDGTYDFCKQMTEIKPYINNYDLAFYNQESIIGGANLGYSSYPRFNSPDAIGDCMISMGFNVVALANNHTMDKNEKGVLYSTEYWKNKDVLTAGSYSSLDERNEIRIKEKNGIKYTMLSYTTVTNGLIPPSGKEYLTNIYSDEKVTADINRVKDKVDLLIVSMHWGVEYSQSPSQEQIRVANLLSELGVNIIIGHHPHVLQPIEFINDTLVIYSLGNYFSAQKGDNKLTGLLLGYDITKTVNEDSSSMIKVSNLKAELIYTKYNSQIRDFRIIPFSKITSTDLSNYKTVYEHNKNIITKFYSNIDVTNIK